MTKIYIAGKMRGLPKFNFPLFDAVRDILKAYSFEVISPADIDRQFGIHEADPEPTPETVRAIVRRDVEAILRLDPAHDALVLINAHSTQAADAGWLNSVGARAEMALAKWLGLSIYEFYWTGFHTGKLHHVSGPSILLPLELTPPTPLAATLKARQEAQ